VNTSTFFYYYSAEFQQIYSKGRRRLPQMPVECVTTHRVPISAFLWESHPPPLSSPQQALGVSGMYWGLPELTKNGSFRSKRVDWSNKINPAETMQGKTKLSVMNIK
jgi:hypothetical protein